MALCIRWPKYWSFSFSIRSSNEYSGLISFRIKWFDLLAVQRTLKRFLQHSVWNHWFFSTQPYVHLQIGKFKLRKFKSRPPSYNFKWQLGFDTRSSESYSVHFLSSQVILVVLNLDRSMNKAMIRIGLINWIIQSLFPFNSGILIVFLGHVEIFSLCCEEYEDPSHSHLLPWKP